MDNSEKPARFKNLRKITDANRKELVQISNKWEVVERVEAHEDHDGGADGVQVEEHALAQRLVLVGRRRQAPLLVVHQRQEGNAEEQTNPVGEPLASTPLLRPTCAAAGEGRGALSVLFSISSIWKRRLVRFLCSFLGGNPPELPKGTPSAVELDVALSVPRPPLFPYHSSFLHRRPLR